MTFSSQEMAIAKQKEDELARHVNITIIGTMQGSSLQQDKPLAETGISVFAVSTFDTDYLLVKAASISNPKSSPRVTRRPFNRIPFSNLDVQCSPCLRRQSSFDGVNREHYS